MKFLISLIIVSLVGIIQPNSIGPPQTSSQGAAKDPQNNISFTVQRTEESLLLEAKSLGSFSISYYGGIVMSDDGNKAGISIPWWKFQDGKVGIELAAEGKIFEYFLNPINGKVGGAIESNPIFMRGSGYSLIEESLSWTLNGKHCWELDECLFDARISICGQALIPFNDIELILGISKEKVVGGEFDMSKGGMVFTLEKGEGGEFYFPKGASFLNPTDDCPAKLSAKGYGLTIEEEFIFRGERLLGDGGRFVLYEG